MSHDRPHYLLFAESTNEPESLAEPVSQAQPACGPAGRWRIVLQSVDGSSQLEASDDEQLPAERLELLAVIRGLEAIPQPAQVTLVTSSAYVRRGLRFGLAEWRENGWQWEQYGERSEVPHADLWQRLDRALQIHHVEYRNVRSDTTGTPVPSVANTTRSAERRPVGAASNNLARRAVAGFKAWLRPAGNRRASLCAS